MRGRQKKRGEKEEAAMRQSEDFSSEARARAVQNCRQFSWKCSLQDFVTGLSAGEFGSEPDDMGHSFRQIEIILFSPGIKFRDISTKKS